MKTIARKYFGTLLVEDYPTWWEGLKLYTVLIDGNFEDAFIAESDEKAIDMFISDEYKNRD